MSIDELKHKIKDTPISHIIGQYVHVTKKGSQTAAVCPFHDDTEPSLMINDSKNMFMCFVDNIGGDAITFVQKYLNLEFIDALKNICDKMGWDFERYNDRKNKNPKVELAQKILSKAMLVYRKLGVENKSEDFQSFVKNRKLTKEVVDNFMLGYAPNTNVISHYLQSIKDQKEKDQAINVALEIKLIGKDQIRKGSYYDTFRDRVMFPIWDQFGHNIGFGGRAMKDSQKAKYLNSFESIVFNKKNNLYGLHLAKNEIRAKDGLILVEGYMDLIALHQHQFNHSVAVMGVALSQYALTGLKALTKNFYLALDGDQAGFKAMTRINELCMENGVLPRYIDLAPHKDPDEFLQNEGRLTFNERIEAAKPFIDILIEKSLPQSIPEISDRKIEVLQSLFELLAPLGKSLEATERVISVARTLGLKTDSSQILTSYYDSLEQNLKHTKKFIPEKPVVEEPEYQPEQEEVPMPSEALAPNDTPMTKVEKLLLQELIQYPDILQHDEMTELLDFVGQNEVKTYVLKLQNLLYEIDDSEYIKVVRDITLNGDFSNSLKETVGASVFKYQKREVDERTTKKQINDIKKRLGLEMLKQKKKSLKEKQKNAFTQEENQALLNEIIEVDKQIKQNNLK